MGRGVECRAEGGIYIERDLILKDFWELWWTE